MGQFLGSAVTIPYKKSEKLSLACLFEVFTGLWLSTPLCIKGNDYVKNFVRVLVLLVINTKFLKNGEQYIVGFQFNLCSTPYKCVLRRRFVFPVF